VVLANLVLIHQSEDVDLDKIMVRYEQMLFLY
jgi:hypothetical protein